VILHNERSQSLIRLVTHLQAEGKTVLEAKLTLLELQRRAETEASSVHGTPKQASTDDALKKVLEKNSKRVDQIIGYLKTNAEATDVAATQPLQQLL